MNLKYKAGFIAMVAIIDIMVIVLVVINNGKTNIKNDISNKTAAHVLKSSKNKISVDESIQTESEKNEIEVTEEQENMSQNILPDDSQNMETKEEVENENNQEVEVVEQPVIVYDNMTMEQLAEKLDRSLNSSISGKGYLIASYSLEKGVDPYLATGIILLETGCSWECSSLVQTCNNVGGQKGTGCGSYMAYNTLDDGIKGFIDNLYKNYYSYGLTTPEQMNSKYAESTEWATKVNAYIEKIQQA